MVVTSKNQEKKNPRLLRFYPSHNRRIVFPAAVNKKKEKKATHFHPSPKADPDLYQTPL